jgi:molecular chaperone GrpE (heat shock protein)
MAKRISKDIPTIIQMKESNEMLALRKEIKDLNNELKECKDNYENLNSDFDEYKNDTEIDDAKLNDKIDAMTCFLESLKSQAYTLKYKYYNKDVPSDIKDLIALISDMNPHNDEELMKDSHVLDFTSISPF